MADATSDQQPGDGGPGGEAMVRTFLLADLRGYTRFTAENGDDAASAVARRLAGLVGATVPKFGGELLEVRGDETLCVFLSARQALRASVELQRLLRAPKDDEPFPLGVGMGLDAGEATPTDGGYRGAALNLAGRLVSAAGPGEVLATERLVRLSGQVDGLHWSRPRSMRLKGLVDPELVVRVEADELIPPPPSPPPNPPSRERSQLIVGGVGLLAVAVAVIAIVVWSGGGAASVRVQADSIVAVSPSTGRVVADVPLGGHRPGPLMAAFNEIWVGEPAAQTLAWFSPTRQIVQSVGVSSAPVNLTATRTAVLTYDGSSGVGSQIDPSILQPVSFTVPNPSCGGLSSAGLCDGGGIAAHNKTVWASTINSETVWRLSADNLNRHGRSTSHVYGDVLTYGLGAVWACGDRGAYLYRIDPNHGRLVGRYDAGGAGLLTTPALVTADGQVWVVNGSSITVVDPNDPTHPAQVAVHPGLTAAAATATDLWVTTNDGQIYRVSLFTKQVKRITNLHHAAAGIVIADRRVWVSVA